jgi:hypothetical protein
VALAVVGGVALAAIPDGQGNIHGCYGKPNGQLRVVESASDCKNNESALQWNQAGPQGPPGAAGISGYEVIHEETAQDDSDVKRLHVECPDGKQPLGGGAHAFRQSGEDTFSPDNVAITASDEEPGGWFVNAVEVGSGPTVPEWKLQGTAICAFVA